jgi:hypothetical protein
MTYAEKRKYQQFLEESDVEDPDSKGGAGWLYARWKCQNDLYYLGAIVLGLEKAKDKRGRKRLDPKVHKKMCIELMREDDTLQLYPRNHMKSTWVKFWIIQQILKNQNVRIGLWSKTATLVGKELEAIKKYLEDPLLMELFPEIIVPRSKWEKDTREAFTILRDPEMGTPPQENQVECWGVGATVTGHHYDYHVYDDIIDQDSVTSATQIEKVEDWWQYMQSIKDISAIEKIIGTRYHNHDIYGRILAEGYFEEENIIIEKALIGNRPFYKFYTYKDLMKLKKRMGEQKFSTQMMNDAVPKEGRIFVPPYPLYRPEDFPKEVKYYISVDPAATTRRHSDESGICVGAVDLKNPSRVHFVEAEGKKLKPERLADYLLEKIIKYRPRKVGIELGLQQALQPLIDIKIKEWEGDHKEYIRPTFVPIPTGKTAKADKLNRTIGAMIRDNRALFPGEYINGDLQPKRSFLPMFRQFDFFNPATDKNEDDIIDSAAIMIQTIEHFAPAHWYKGKELEVMANGYTMESLMKMNEKKKYGYGWQLAC